MLALAFEFLGGAVAGASFGEFCVCASEISFFRRAFQRFFRFMLCRKRSRFVQLLATKRAAPPNPQPRSRT